MKVERHVLDYSIVPFLFGNLAFLLASGLDCGHSTLVPLLWYLTGDFHSTVNQVEKMSKVVKGGWNQWKETGTLEVLVRQSPTCRRQGGLQASARIYIEPQMDETFQGASNKP